MWFEKEIDVSHGSVLGKSRNCLHSLMLFFWGIVFRNNSRYFVSWGKPFPSVNPLGPVEAPVITEEVGEQPEQSRNASETSPH